jgi:hypothetical protein
MVLTVLGACDDDSSPPTDSTPVTEGGSDGPTADTMPWPDQAVPDQFVWPDQGQDQIVWPDMYSGTPFGCQSDADCFGQKCCPTPWGVKLCAATCPK